MKPGTERICFAPGALSGKKSISAIQVNWRELWKGFSGERPSPDSGSGAWIFTHRANTGVGWRPHQGDWAWGQLKKCKRDVDGLTGNVRMTNHTHFGFVSKTYRGQNWIAKFAMFPQFLLEVNVSREISISSIRLGVERLERAEGDFPRLRKSQQNWKGAMRAYGNVLKMLAILEANWEKPTLSRNETIAKS